MELKIRQEGSTYYLEGVINEFANFQPLMDSKESEITINWKGVARINSTGVREWINALEKVTEGRQVTFEECPVIVVYQMNMIPNFTSKSKVSSVFAPYFCEECEHQEDYLMQMESFDLEEGVPELKCSECDAELFFDDEEESYFYFLELVGDK